jgi:hypothetical protein
MLRTIKFMSFGMIETTLIMLALIMIYSTDVI